MLPDTRQNKAGYAALGAPKGLYTRRRYRPTHQRTDRPYYRDTSQHFTIGCKKEKKLNAMKRNNISSLVILIKKDESLKGSLDRTEL